MHILSDTKALHHSLIGLFPLAIYKMAAHLPLNHLIRYSMSFLSLPQPLPRPQNNLKQIYFTNTQTHPDTHKYTSFIYN